MVKTVCNNYRQLAPVLFGKGAINQTGDIAARWLQEGHGRHRRRHQLSGVPRKDRSLSEGKGH